MRKTLRTNQKLSKSLYSVIGLFDEAATRIVLKLAGTAGREKGTAYPLLLELVKLRSAFYRSDVLFNEWEEAIEKLRMWMPVIARFDRASKEERDGIHLEFDYLLDSSLNRVVLSSSDGELSLSLAAIDANVDALFVTALLPFVIKNGWEPSRIGRCQFRRCGEWFMREASGPRVYCSTAHGNSERQAQIREQVSELKLGSRPRKLGAERTRKKRV